MLLFLYFARCLIRKFPRFFQKNRLEGVKMLPILILQDLETLNPDAHILSHSADLPTKMIEHGGLLASGRQFLSWLGKSSDQKGLFVIFVWWCGNEGEVVLSLPISLLPKLSSCVCYGRTEHLCGCLWAILDISYQRSQKSISYSLFVPTCFIRYKKKGLINSGRSDSDCAIH